MADSLAYSRKGESRNASMECQVARLFERSFSFSQSHPCSTTLLYFSCWYNFIAGLSHNRLTPTPDALYQNHFFPAVSSAVQAHQSAEVLHLCGHDFHLWLLRLGDCCAILLWDAASWGNFCDPQLRATRKEVVEPVDSAFGCWRRHRLLYSDLAYRGCIAASISKEAKDWALFSVWDWKHVGPLLPSSSSFELRVMKLTDLIELAYLQSWACIIESCLIEAAITPGQRFLLFFLRQ